MTAAGTVPFHLSRPRLLRRLDAAVHRKLTIVRAPAGYGKSTLVKSWVSAYEAAPVISLSLDRADLHGEHFADLLVAALADVERWAAGVRTAVTTIREAVVVLDGLDAVGGPLFDEFAQLVAQAAHLRFVLVTRIDPVPLSNAARSTGDLTELREVDLALDRDEALVLLREVSGTAVTPQQADALFARTEGWPAGHRMAAMAIRGGGDIDEVVEEFKGAPDSVARYLDAEVLDRQPPPLRRFLICTTVLDGLNGELCAAVLEDRSADAARKAESALRRLEAGSVFLTSLGGGWFRYHPMFRDFVTHVLRTSHPGLEAELLERAADWHLRHGQAERAARYLRDAADWSRLLQLVTGQARTLFEEGQAPVGQRWMEWIPAGVRGRSPIELLEEAALETMAGKSRLAEQTVGRLGPRSRLAAGEGIVADTITTCWIENHSTPELTIEAADRLLAALPETPAATIPDVFGLTRPASVRVIAQCNRARALWHLGRTADARSALEALVGPDEGYPPWSLNVLGSLALVEAWSGRLRSASLLVGAAGDAARGAHLTDHPAAIDARLAAAHLLVERNDLESASVVLDEVRALAHRAGRGVAVAIEAVERGRLRLASAEPQRGLDELAAFHAAGWAPPALLLDGALRSIEARLSLTTGDVDRAAHVLGGADAGSGMPALDPALDAVRIQVAVARGDCASARHILERWTDAEPRWRVEGALWRAVVADAEGDRRRGVRYLAEVLPEAQAEGFVRLFLDAGRPALRLLRTLRRARPSGYVGRLVRLAERAEIQPSRRSGDLAEPLSARELAILRFLPSNQSNAEIAERLYVSVNTLKTHLRSIYRKMGTAGRREAVERAEELGLV